MKYRRISGAALLLSAAMLLSACATEQASVQAASATGQDSVQAETSTTQQDSVQAASTLPDATPVDAAPAEIEVSDAFSTRDLSGDYDASAAVRITLGGASASCDSGAVTVSGATVTITAAGTYLLSGTLYNGTLIVDAGKQDKVQLVLDNASINSDTFAAIYVKQADKVFLTLPDGTVNTLTNGGTFTAIDDNNVDGTIFSKDDLTLNGTGKLVVNSPAKHGIVCKDDLVVAGGTYEVTAASHAISAKDSFSVAGGTFTLTAGKDGVHVENSEDAALGNVYFADATMTITADGDGVSASGTLRVDGGTFAVRTGGGKQNAKASSEESRKGFKADGNIAFNGGTVAIDAADDGISSDANVTISGGNYAVAVGDDGIHADGLAQIDGGTLDINGAEGIEATYIRINDGTVNIYATDDGINSTRDSSAYSSAVEFNGGETTVEVGPGDTDGIDSNGALIITGGTVSVTGNSAFDYDGTLTFTGGTVIINGEQVDTIPNQMFGRGGGMGRGGTMPDGAFGGPRGNWSPDGNSGTAPDGSTTPPDGSTRQWGGRGGKGRPTGGTTNSGDSVTPDVRGGKRRPADETANSDSSVTSDARGGKTPGGQGSVTPNGRGGKGRTQTEVPDAVTVPTQKIAAI